MAGNQLAFVESAFIGKPSLSCGLNYPFWKVCIKIFMEFINRGIWKAMVNGYSIPTDVVDDKIVQKPFESWTVEEIRRG